MPAPGQDSPRTTASRRQCYDRPHPSRPHRGTSRRGAAGVVERHPLLQVRECRGSRAQVQQGRPQGTVRLQEHGRVLRLLRQGKELRSQGVRAVLQLGALQDTPTGHAAPGTAAGVFQVLAEVPGAGVGLFYLRRCVALGSISDAPRARCNISSCWLRAGVVGSVLSNSAPW